jgi:alkanesulfonate monooxygenase SsuD/methylene tetrahydromethanopterin reductase-like flavin-dependent oxidoreductase (luciferase family)
MPGHDRDDDHDDVLDRRAKIRRVVVAAKRVGYSALLVAIVMFAVALATGLAAWAVTSTIVALVAACIILPVPIVLGYGLRAADREERERGGSS